MKRASRLLLLPAAWFLVVAAGCAAAPAPDRAGPAGSGPDLAREDAWYELSLEGAHVGWMHRFREPRGDGAIVTREEGEMQILRFGESIPVRTSHAYLETAEGRPLSFESEILLGSTLTKSEGRIEGGRLRLVVHTAGGTQQMKLDWPEGAVFPYGADRLALRHGIEPGTSWSYTTFSPDLNGRITETVRVDGPSAVATNEGVRELLRFTSTTRELAGQETHVWLDEGLRQVVVEVPTLKMRMVRTSEKRARRGIERGPDLARTSFIVAEIPVRDPDRVERAVYRLKRGSGGWEWADLHLPPRQRVLEEEGGTVLLEVRRGLRAEAPPPEERGEFPEELVAGTPYLEIGSPEVRRALKEARGPDAGVKSDTMGNVARRLARWVYSNVDERALDVGFATAAEVARDRRGDCTEHAVLLAALLRGAGIPSRVRAGLLHIGGGFGYHLWTQAWIDGRWVDLDATLGDGPIGALHIGLATSDLGTDSPLLGLAAIGPLMGDLEIEIVELDLDKEEAAAGATRR